ncbi:MAG TPA: beta-galactosidase [Planctomycetota bacterium]|nr:beta-galactosidase [Planctomycetota bacterium]
MKRGLLATLLVLVTGCTSHSGSSFVGSSTAASTSSTTGSVSSGTVAPTTSGVPHVQLTQRGVAIDGKVVPLIGGEVQYYRVRDPNWDVAKTQQLWQDALDQLQAAGCNLVSTYVPWDFHEQQSGQIDFTGVRDLRFFLECCYQRGLVVAIKPGPFINSEWPYGLGSFGAIPQWWKDAHPDALALDPQGNFFTFDLFGRPQGRQPSFFSPDFRQAAARWFSIVAPIIQYYTKVHPTIAFVQVDNETNFYFKSRFSTDYSTWGKQQYQAWLQKKYGSLTGINTDPPTAAGDNQRVQDWFDAGWDGIAEYQQFLRSTWESLGIQEPDVLFTTNDSPHPMPTMDLLLWDARTKNKAGMPGIDAYPKQFPWSLDAPLDYPFLASFFTKRFMNATGTKGALGPELEGGLFDLPLSIPLPMPVATTDHVLLEFFGHGGVMGSIYMFHGGLNLDGSRYFEMAPIDQNGNPTPRYPVVQRWASNVVNQDLIASSDVEAPFALIVGARFCAPITGINSHPGWIQAREAPGILGWLEDAGIEPVVLDGASIQKGDLDKYKGVLYVNPDAAEDHLATALDDYVQRGGVLVNLLGTGRFDASWQPGVATQLLADGLFSDGTKTGAYEEALGEFAPPSINFTVSGQTGWMSTSPYEGQYTVGPGGQPFAWDRTFAIGTNGPVVGWTATKGMGQVVFLATSPGRPFRDFLYYSYDSSTILAARELGRFVLQECGVSPVLEVEDGKAQAFARKGPALVFLASRLDHQDQVTVKVLDPTALGLSTSGTYTVTDALNGTPLGQATGAALATTGVTVTLPAYGTAVIRLN